jgi:hypothetical protein
MEVICIRNVSEISHFLTVIEFNKKFGKKRVDCDVKSAMFLVTHFRREHDLQIYKYSSVAETLALLTKPLYFPNMKCLE